jgi:hypothetical protein
LEYIWHIDYFKDFVSQVEKLKEKEERKW